MSSGFICFPSSHGHCHLPRNLVLQSHRTQHASWKASARIRQGRWLEEHHFRCHAELGSSQPLPPADAANSIGKGRPAQENLKKQKLAAEYSEQNDHIKALAKKVQKGLKGTSIYLVGMMGSGKSTVAKVLGRTLDYPSIDTDDLAESSSKQKISDIFEEDGEEAFRDLETAVLKELMAYTSVVVSTGGGAVLKRLNWGYMQHAIVVWLHGPPELLAHRAVKDSAAQRPLLQPDTDAEHAFQDGSHQKRLEQAHAKLAAILKDREGKYAQADIKISLEDSNSGPSGANAAVVAERVLLAIKARIEGDRRQQPNAQRFKGFGQAPKAS